MVSSPEFVAGNKKLLQAHVDVAILGQSSTQLFTHEAFLWKTPIIPTTNNWEYSHMSKADQKWIDTNVVAVHIESRVWVRVWVSIPASSANKLKSLTTCSRACLLPDVSITY